MTRFLLVSVILMIMLACSPSGSDVPPLRGKLIVEIHLPEGKVLSTTGPSITVAGPAGFEQLLSESTVLSDLVVGEYTVAAGVLEHAGDTYYPDPPSQTVALSASETETVSISYSTDASFKLSVPTSVSVALGESAEVSIAITRANFEAAVSLSVSGLPTGVSASFVPPSAIGQVASLQLSVAPNASLGSYPLTVKGASGALEHAASLTLHITSVPMAVTNLSIQTYGNSRQVRQGAGKIFLDIAGQNLSGISAAKVGSLDAVIEANSATSALLSTNIPHGLTPGSLVLSLTATAGTVEVADAVVVTVVTAGPTGSDASGRGTPDSPLRSLTRAVGLADIGDSIFLQNGSYSVTTGETWPLGITGRTLTGESQEGVKLIGDMSTRGLSYGGPPGLESTLSNLSLMNFSEAVVVGAAKLLMESVQLTSSGSGLFIAGGSVVVTKSGIQNNSEAGITVQGGVLQLTDSLISGNKQGIVTLLPPPELPPESTLSLNQTTITDNQVGVQLATGSVLETKESTISKNETGIEATGDAKLTLTKMTITESSSQGILLDGSSELALSDSSITQNAIGLVLRGSAYAAVQESRLSENSIHGVWLQDQTALELLTSDISHNGLYGLRADNLAAVRTRNSTFNNNAQSGLFMRNNSTLLFKDSEADANTQNGILAMQEASLALEDSSASHNSVNGVMLLGESKLQTLRGSIMDNDYGVRAEGASGPSFIRSTSFSGNFIGVHASGSARVSLEGVTFQDSRNLKGASGLYIADSAFVVLGEGSLIERTVLGVRIAGSSVFGMRDTTIRQTEGSAIDVSGTPLVVDLGNATSGGNRISAGSMDHAFAITDVRPAGQSVVIGVRRDDFFGPFFLGNCSSIHGTHTGPTELRCGNNVGDPGGPIRILDIRSAGNTIQVFGP